MNKFAFILFFNFSLALAAEVKLDIVAETALAYRTKMGEEDALIIGKSADAYFFNGYRIPIDKVKKLDADLKNTFLIKPANKNSKSCRTGSFVHTVTMNKTVTKERGCLSDSRYRELTVSFRKFR